MLVGCLLQLALQIVQLTRELVGLLEELNKQGDVVDAFEHQILKLYPMLVQCLGLGVDIVALLWAERLQMLFDGLQQQIDELTLDLWEQKAMSNDF